MYANIIKHNDHKDLKPTPAGQFQADVTRYIYISILAIQPPYKTPGLSTRIGFKYQNPQLNPLTIFQFARAYLAHDAFLRRAFFPLCGIAQKPLNTTKCCSTFPISYAAYLCAYLKDCVIFLLSICKILVIIESRTFIIQQKMQIL